MTQSINTVETEPQRTPEQFGVSFFDVFNYIQTIDFVPTYTPQRLSEQFVLVTAGGSSRAYIYDTKFTGGGWRYLTLT